MERTLPQSPVPSEAAEPLLSATALPGSGFMLPGIAWSWLQQGQEEAVLFSSRAFTPTSNW